MVGSASQSHVGIAQPVSGLTVARRCRSLSPLQTVVFLSVVLLETYFGINETVNLVP